MFEVQTLPGIPKQPTAFIAMPFHPQPDTKALCCLPNGVKNTRQEGKCLTQPSPADWTIRPYPSGDEQAVVRLFHRVFGQPITEAHGRWKRKPLPSPVENVWLAIDEGRPLFHYGDIPYRFHLPTGHQIARVSVEKPAWPSAPPLRPPRP